MPVTIKEVACKHDGYQAAFELQAPFRPKAYVHVTHLNEADVYFSGNIFSFSRTSDAISYAISLLN